MFGCFADLTFELANEIALPITTKYVFYSRIYKGKLRLLRNLIIGPFIPFIWSFFAEIGIKQWCSTLLVHSIYAFGFANQLF